MRRQATVLLLAGAILFPSGTASAQFVQQGSKLVVPSDPMINGDPRLGSAVSLSPDGNTAIVGGSTEDFGAGAAWIFTRSGTTWTQGPKLVGTGHTSNSVMGSAVAISADGNTAIIGGPGDNGNVGAAWIFVRSGSSWSQQGSKLVGTGSSGTSFQAASVAISADGNTAIIGGYGDGGFVGAAWVFTRTGSTWTQQGSKLAGNDSVGTSYQGRPVSLSDDGNTAIVGGAGDNGDTGAAWVFTRSGATWTQQGAKLTGSGAVGTAQFGAGAAVSADGNTAAIGGDYDNSSLGAVWIFTRDGSTWTQQGPKLVGTGSSGAVSHQGKSVSLSSNGNILFEGGYADGASGFTSWNGASWAFVRDGNSWSQLGSKIVGTGAANGTDGAQQGYASCLSSDGLTAIVGGLQDDSYAGAVWIFTRTLPTLPPNAIGDFDGDGKADVTVLKTNGDWASLTSASSFMASSVVGWSAAGHVPVRGDFDGDGKEDPALYNPSTGHWAILKSSSNYTVAVFVNWGGAGYTAVPGDYDGDGKTDVAVYETSSGSWLILKSSTHNAAMISATLGGAGKTPIGGQDFDGDQIADLAVYDQATGSWSILKSSTAFLTGFSVGWGGPGYVIVPGDYDGDHKADVGIYQPSSGYWYILKSGSGFTTVIAKSWGGIGYVPVPGDYDGDGKFDLGLYQQSTGSWYALKSSSNFTTTLTITGWGSGVDVPISPAIAVGHDLLRAGDFDRDSRSEIMVYNQSSGVWSWLTSRSGFTNARSVGWGGSAYTPVPGDYDGDGRPDLGIYDGSTGYWYVLLSGADFTTSLTKSAGGAGWTPVPGDYDGDGKTDFVVYNRTTGQWYGLKSGTGYTTALSITYGGSSYFAVPADYDGDGRTDIGVYEGNTGAWSVLLSSTNYATSLSKNAGGTGYTPVPADYDGDGKADFVVYGYLSSGLWYGVLSGSSYTTTMSISWGGSGYTPVMGDYDGDGRADLATYVSATGTWYILLSGSNYTATITKNWGGAGYAPQPAYPTIN